MFITCPFTERVCQPLAYRIRENADCLLSSFGSATEQVLSKYISNEWTKCPRLHLGATALHMKRSLNVVRSPNLPGPQTMPLCPCRSQAALPHCHRCPRPLNPLEPSEKLRYEAHSFSPLFYPQSLLRNKLPTPLIHFLKIMTYLFGSDVVGIPNNVLSWPWKIS